MPANNKPTKTIRINAKCSDLFWAALDEGENRVGEIDGYVPAWFPNPQEEHYGDYVSLEIDVKTGRILNWKRPTTDNLKDFKKALTSERGFDIVAP
jgi:hypothetical protein